MDSKEFTQNEFIEKVILTNPLIAKEDIKDFTKRYNSKLKKLKVSILSGKDCGQIIEEANE